MPNVRQVSIVLRAVAETLPNREQTRQVKPTEHARETKVNARLCHCKSEPVEKRNRDGNGDTTPEHRWVAVLPPSLRRIEITSPALGGPTNSQVESDHGDEGRGKPKDAF
jgi:hypothetical protein